MVKDHFYYCLKDRLIFSQEYANECLKRLRYIEIYKKADYEFYKNNKLLFFFEELVNLPTNIYRSYKITKMRIHLTKCLYDIKVLQREIDNYE